MDVAPAEELMNNRSMAQGPLLTFVGPGRQDKVEEFFPMLVEVLESIGPLCRLAALWHPKSNPSLYREELESRVFDTGNVLLLQNELVRKLGTNEEIYAASDLVVGATSTDIVTSCYLGRPTLSIVPPRGPNEETISRRGIMSMPTSDVGASWHADDENDVYEIVSELLTDKSWNHMCENTRAIQVDNYKLDGQNTQRIVAVVESLL